MRPIPTRRLALLVLAVLAGVTCTDAPTAPRFPDPVATSRPAQLALAPAFSREAVQAYGALRSFGLSITNVRVVLQRPGGGVVIDTVVQIAPEQTEISILLSVPVQGQQAEFDAVVQLRDGNQVLFEGTQRVTAQVGTGAGGNPPPPPTIPINYVGPGAAARSLRVAPRDTTIGTGAAIGFTAQALDATGRPVADAVVRWSLDDPSLGGIGAQDGAFRAADRRGTARITAQLPNGVSDQVQLRIVPPPSELLLVAGAGQTGVAGRALPSPIVIEVRAADGVPVAGETVTFAASSGASVSGASAITDAAGRAGTTLTLGRTPGSYAVSAAVGRLTPLTVTAVATAGAPASIDIARGAGQSVTPGEVLQPFVVRVLDDLGNPVPGAGVVWAVTRGSASLSSNSSTTNAAGEASVIATADRTAGTLTVTAAVATPRGSPAGQVVAFNAIVRAGAAAALSLVSGSPQSGAAGSAAAAPLVVQVSDAFGNAVSGATVRWTATAGSVSPASVTSGADGRAQAAYTFGAGEGHATVTAAVDGVAGAAGLVQFDMTARAGAPATIAIVSGDGQSAAAGSTFAPFVVRVRDALGNPVAGVTVVWVLSQGDGSLQPVSGTTAADGIASSTFTAGRIAGAVRVVASIGTGAGALSTTFSATARASGPAQLVLVGDSAPRLTAGTLFGGEGAPAAPLVRVTDGAGNPVAGVTLGLALTGPGLEAPVVSTAVSDDHGLARIFPAEFGPERAGSWRATVSTAEIPGPELHVTVVVVHAAAAALVKVAGDSQSGAPGIAVPIAPSVQVTDGFGNAVPGVAVTFAVIAGGGSVTGGEATTDSSGIATVASWVLGAAGAQSLGASAGALSTRFSATLPAGPGPLAHLALTTRPRVVTPLDSLLVPPPVVHATDAAGAPVPGVAVTATFVGSPASLSTAESATAVTDAAGDARFSGLAFSDGSGLVRLTFASGAITTDTIGITIVPPGLAISELAIAPSSIRIGGASAQFTAVISNAQASARSGLAVQGTIVQGAASRAAGGTLLACPSASPGTLPVGLCPASFSVSAGNSASGSGTLVAGPATYRLELRSEATVLATAELPVTLLAPEAPPVAGLEVVHGRATGHAGDHLLLAVRAVNGGTPVPGVVVNWSALEGSFEFDSVSAASTTDAEGVARMTILPVEPAQLRSAGAQASMPPAGSWHAVRAAVASNGAIYADLRALVLPAGSTKGWFGGKPDAADDWDDPDNWNEGGPPGLGDNVYIPGWPGHAKPKLRGGRGVNDLVIEASDAAGLELDGNALEVRGTLAARGGGVSGTGGAQLRLTGSAKTVRGALAVPAVSIETDVSLDGGTTFGGSVTVGSGGRLRVGAARAEVAGNLSITGDAYLGMNDAAGHLHVAGNLLAAGANHAGWLTAGTLQLDGNLIEAGGAYEAFQANNGHVVRLTGGATQVVSFEHAGYSHLSHAQVAKTGGSLRFAGDQHFTGDLEVTSATPVSLEAGSVFEVQGAVRAAAGSNLAGIPNLRLAGDGSFPAIAGTPPGRLSIAGDRTLPGDVILDAALDVVPGGRLRLGDRSLTVDGDVTLAGDAFLQMANDSSTLRVHGDLHAGGGNHSGWLTAGTLELTGNLIEAGGAYEAFQATGSHTTKLVGGSAQTVSFEHPSYSRFQHLDVATSNGVTFSGAQYVQGNMTVRAPATVRQEGSTTFEISGGLTTESGSDLSGIPNITTRGGFTSFPVIAGRGPARLTIGSDVTLGADATFGGAIDVVSGGRLRLGGKALSVNGAFSLSGDAYLQMVDSTSRLTVAGAFAAGGANHSGWLTAGTLAIGGSFTEENGAYEAFQASGTHLTRLFGASARTVSFAHDQHSWFNELEIEAGVDAAFVSDARVKKLTNRGKFSVSPGKTLVVEEDLDLQGGSVANAGPTSGKGNVSVGSGRCKQNGGTVNGNIPNCPGP